MKKQTSVRNEGFDRSEKKGPKISIEWLLLLFYKVVAAIGWVIYLPNNYNKTKNESSGEWGCNSADLCRIK